MPPANAQWAYNALHHLSGMRHREAATAAVHIPRTFVSGGSSQPFIRPILAISASSDSPLQQQQHQCPRVLLLAPRPEGLMGVEVTALRSPLQLVPLDSTATAKARRMAAHLANRKFTVMTRDADNNTQGSWCRPPVLVHTNHLVGWKLNHRASAVYMHTIPELCRLSRVEAKTLDSNSCILSRDYYEWDCWRELLQEPGWSLHITDESTVDTIITAGPSLTIEDIRSRADAVTIDL